MTRSDFSRLVKKLGNLISLFCGLGPKQVDEGSHKRSDLTFIIDS